MSIQKITDENQWHKMRSSTIGGSEVGIIFGCSPYGTRNELYHAKRGSYENDLSGNKLIAFGQKMESIIAELIADEMNWSIVNSEDYYIHPVHTFLGCTLDYYVVESEDGPGLLEIKNVNPFAPDWSQTQAPAHVEMQMQHQFLVVNAAREAAGMEPFSWGAIGSLHGGNPNDIRVMMRKPDTKLHDFIIKECEAFWNSVVSGDEPPLLGKEKELDHIVSMFKRADVTKDNVEYEDRRGDNKVNDLIIQYENAREKASDARKRQEEIKAQILHEMMCFKDDGVIKTTLLRTDNYAVEAGLYKVNRKAQPAKTTESLRFKITEIGGDDE